MEEMGKNVPPVMKFEDITKIVFTGGLHLVVGCP